MAERIAITGVGIVSALGTGQDVHINALRERRSGLHRARWLESRHIKDFLLGEVDLSDDALAELLRIPTGDNGYTRTDLLSIAGVRELMSGIDIAWLQEEPLAFINANTVGGMGTVEKRYMDLIRG